MKKYDTNLFIKKANEVHGNKYDYCKVAYTDSATKVCIICPEHGEFYQTPSAHLRGNICPKCANKNRGQKKRWDKGEFIKRARLIHGDKYDYSKVDYRGNTMKVCIICPEHGEFYQTPMAHIFGKQGCPKCSGRGLSTEEIVSMFIKKHGYAYDYRKVVYKKMHDKVCIICPEHGEFYQTPSKHILGQGCPKCGKTELGRRNRMTRDEFIKRAKEVHGDRYIYDYIDYKTSHDKIKIICPSHGEFTQLPYDHINGHGCPHCANLISRPEIEIYEELCNLLGEKEVFIHNRGILRNRQEIDIYVPSLKLGVEYNGLRWHSEEFGKVKNYHLNKMIECNKNGISLIHVFEDEYLFHKDIVMSKLKHIVKKDGNLNKVMGRKCIVNEITYEEATDFLGKNHIQGGVKSTVYLGAYFNETLVGVMCFMRGGEDEWILTRCATDNCLRCQGVCGKLFKYFVRKYDPHKIKSFADRRWTINKENNLYVNLGFKLDSVLKPDYHYVDKTNPTKRIHKFNLRKKTLHNKHNLPMDLTETEMVKRLNLTRIWDCGLYKYVWNKKTDV